MSCKSLKTIENLEICVKAGPCEAVWCVPRRNIRQVSFLKMGFSEWKCHIHNHFHVVELLLPTTKITEHLLKSVGLVLLKSSRLHSLQEVLGPRLKTWVQLLWYHKCIKTKRKSLSPTLNPVQGLFVWLGSGSKEIIHVCRRGVCVGTGVLGGQRRPLSKQDILIIDGNSFGDQAEK